MRLWKDLELVCLMLTVSQFQVNKKMTYALRSGWFSCCSPLYTYFLLQGVIPSAVFILPDDIKIYLMTKVCARNIRCTNFGLAFCFTSKDDEV